MEKCTLIRLELIKRLLVVALRNQDKTKHKHNSKTTIAEHACRILLLWGKVKKTAFFNL